MGDAADHRAARGRTGTGATAALLAVKGRLAAQLAAAMRERGVGKAALARRMGTSRSAVDRLLDGANPALTLATLAGAARALGKRLRIELD